MQIKEGRVVSLTFRNQPKGSLIVKKTDTNGKPLPGAEFHITTAAGCEVGVNGVIGSSTLTRNGIFTTDANGEIKIGNLAPGTYVLTELKAPDGYVLDGTPVNVVIGTGGDTQVVTVKDAKAWTLIVDKRDSKTGKPLEGVQFKITTASGEFVPDENGWVSSNGIYFTDADGRITVNGVVGTLMFRNEPLVSLTITKLDSVTGKPVPGAEFTVRDSRSNVLGKYVTGKPCKTVVKNTMFHTLLPLQLPRWRAILTRTPKAPPTTTASCRSTPSTSTGSATLASTR